MKKMRKCWAFLAVLILLAGSAFTTYAAGTVTYDGTADEFIFAPGSDHSPTDLFGSFYNVMPGDTLTQQIVIKNDPDGGVKVRVYLRSKGAQEGTDEFLSQMTLMVKQSDDSVLFSAPADEPAQLNGWVYLGTAYAGAEITLDVILNVPLTMGNEFQNKLGYIDWEFKVEELPSAPSDPQPGDGVDTGDSNSIEGYIVLMAVSLAALVIILIGWRRRIRGV